MASSRDMDQVAAVTNQFIASQFSEKSHEEIFLKNVTGQNMADLLDREDLDVDDENKVWRRSANTSPQRMNESCRRAVSNLGFLNSTSLKSVVFKNIIMRMRENNAFIKSLFMEIKYIIIFF